MSTDSLCKWVVAIAAAELVTAFIMQMQSQQQPRPHPLHQPHMHNPLLCCMLPAPARYVSALLRLSRRLIMLCCVLVCSPSTSPPPHRPTGITYSDDKLLQTRIFSYADTQRHRLGPNYLQIPVNAPQCAHHNNHHDGFMNFMHRDEEVNYFPSRWGGGGCGGEGGGGGLLGRDGRGGS